MSHYEIVHYKRPDGRVPFDDWFFSLKDVETQARVLTSINRLRLGNFSNCEPAREGVHELKINFGPGYRIYFAKIGLALVLFLCGGSKKGQSRNISTAIDYLVEYKKLQKEEKKNADKKAR